MLWFTVYLKYFMVTDMVNFALLRASCLESSRHFSKGTVLSVCMFILSEIVGGGAFYGEGGVYWSFCFEVVE